MLICVGSSGLRLNRCAPHSRQKHFSNPPSGAAPTAHELLALEEPEGAAVDARLGGYGRAGALLAARAVAIAGRAAPAR